MPTNAGIPFVIVSQSEYEAVRYVLDLVDQLGAAHGFDPSELVSPSTGQPFGPVSERLREGLRLFEALPSKDERRAAGGR